MKFAFKSISRISIVLILVTQYYGTALAATAGDIQSSIFDGFSKLDHRFGTDEADNRFDKNKIKKSIDVFSETATGLKTHFKTMTADELSSYVDKQVANFNANAAMQNSTFKLVSKNVDKAGNLHIGIQQYLKNIPVIDAFVALHIDKNGELYSITGRYQQNESIETSVGISKDQAIASAKGAIAGEAITDLTKPELSIVGGRLVYMMKIQEKGIPGWWNITVDAITGEVLEKGSSVSFLDPPGYPNNGATVSMTGNICTHEGGANVTFNGWQDNSTTPSQFYLYNHDDHWQVADVNHPKTIFSNASAAWGTANRPGINIAFNMNRIIQFVNDSLNRNSFDDLGGMAICWYPDPTWNNSRWDGTTFHFGAGDGGVNFFEWVTLDVITHEFGHAISQYAGQLHPGSMHDENAAINEAYSDILGTCVEACFQPDGRDQYTLNASRSLETQSDWIMFEDMTRNAGNRWWCRNLRDPTIGAYEGPEPIIYKGDHWRTPSEEHVNSTPLSHIFYLISEGADTVFTVDATYQHLYGPFKGLGLSAARDIAWGVQFSKYINGNSLYPDVRNAWVHHALDLQLDAGIVAQAFAAGAVITKTVNRPVGTTLPPGIPDYPTITAALSAANNHELIYIYSGAYNESFTINKEQIMLVGRDPSVTTINGSVTVRENADDAVLTGFTIISTANAISIDGKNNNSASRVCISGNVISGSSNGINLSYTYACNLLHNKITSSSGGSIAFANSTFNYIIENNISGRGIVLGAASKANSFIGNVLNGVATDGFQITDNLSSDLDVSGNEFMNITGSEVVQNQAGDASNNFQYNVFSNPNGLHLTFPADATGNFIDNLISPKLTDLSMPTVIDYSHNYWASYTGIDLNGDGYGDTELPAAGVDNSPRIKPLYTTLQIIHNGNYCLRSSVSNFNTNIDAVRISGVHQTTANSGIIFGNNAGITTNGNISGSQLLVNSDKWLSDPTNLQGGLLFKKPDGKVFMHVSMDGIIRTRDKVLPNF